MRRCGDLTPMISQATLRGYRATTYAVTLPAKNHIDCEMLGLRLNENSPQADAFLKTAKAQSITCLNAWNPQSRVLNVTRNMAAHQRLRRDLAAYIVLPHLGVPDRLLCPCCGVHPTAEVGIAPITPAKKRDFCRTFSKIPAPTIKTIRKYNHSK